MISRRRKLANWVIRLANIIQTIPLAMISILIIGLGLGVNVVIVTVFCIPSYRSSRIRIPG